MRSAPPGVEPRRGAERAEVPPAALEGSTMSITDTERSRASWLHGFNPSAQDGHVRFTSQDGITIDFEDAYLRGVLETAREGDQEPMFWSFIRSTAERRARWAREANYARRAAARADDLRSLDAYKDRVRAALTEAWPSHSSHISLRDLNEFLSGLDLEEWTPTISGTVRFTVTREVEFEDLEVEPGDDHDEVVKRFVQEEYLNDDSDWDIDALDIDYS